MMEIYSTCLLEILGFSSRFRRFEMKSFLRRPTKNLFVIGTPQNFFYFYRPGRNRQHKLSKSVNRSIEFVHVEAK